MTAALAASRDRTVVRHRVNFRAEQGVLQTDALCVLYYVLWKRGRRVGSQAQITNTPDEPEGPLTGTPDEPPDPGVCSRYSPPRLLLGLEPMDNWKDEYIAKLRCEQDPRLLLAASEKSASKALGCADDPDKQHAGFIYARVATAKALAALAAAILEKPVQS